MTSHEIITGLCRDCLQPHKAGSRCRHCASPRVLIHEELDQLSIAHVDCDAFYASVEKRDNPDLKDKPVIIGGGTRGVVATACYIARINGVASAMPMFKARKLCPNAVIIKPDMAKYSAVGHEIRQLMRAVTPLVEPLSIDEAFMDLTGTRRFHKQSPAATMAALAKIIEDKIGITVSVGLSHNKFLAKIASDLDKPRGFSIIGKAETRSFLQRQPIEIIWGVGKSLKNRLNRDGLTTIASLMKIDEKTLTARYGIIGSRLFHLARGEDNRKISPVSETKSISAETTFNQDILDMIELERRLWLLCEKVAKRAKAKDIAGTTATLKLKTGTFRTFTRNHKLEPATNYANQLFDVARQLLNKEHANGPYRLIGIGLTGLVPAKTIPDQMTLLESTGEKATRIEHALDQLRGKFGDAVIAKGRAFKP
jgi:DNA polymerase IV